MSSMLCEINRHPRDGNITFYEEGHIYKIEGIDEQPISTTTLIGEFFQKFDADKTITRMMNSPKWPSSKYFGMTRDEIKAQWEQNGKEASTLGTIMHAQIEDFFNGALEEYPDTIEFGYFLEFWKWFQEEYPCWKPYRTEWVIFDKELMLAGSVDMLFVNEEGKLWIVDWKRSKEIKKTGYRRAKRPIGHLNDCNYTKYQLQLNTYRYILEKNYGKEIERMDIVVMHPNNESYDMIKADDMSSELGAIAYWRQATRL